MTTRNWAHRAGLGVGLAAAVATLALAPACTKRGDGAGQATGTPANAEHDHAAESAHADEVSLTAEAVEENGVTIGEAKRRTLVPTVVAPARVSFNAEAMAHVGSALRGRAVEIMARLGDEVERNAPLLVIESPELGEAQADFLQKRTTADVVVAQVDFAKGAWERAQALLEKSQGISLTEVQKREAEYKAAVASVRASEAGVKAAENRLRLMGMDREELDALRSTGDLAPRQTVRAPIGGRVVEREVTLGELVGPEREAVMVLADLRTLWVLAEVAEAKLPGVAAGADAWVTLGTGGSERIGAKVAWVSPLIEPATRTARVRIEVDGTHPAMRPGMFAQVEIAVAAPSGDAAAPRLAVPQGAVQTVEGGPAVFVPVEGEPNTFQKRAVRVGAPVGGMVPILAGLQQGEKFVEAGSFILKAELGKGSGVHEH